MKRLKYWVLIGALILIPPSVLIFWNHSVVPIPANIDLTKVVIGKTTVDDFETIIGGGSKMHTCMGSCVYKHIASTSIQYGRTIEISGHYRGPNSGMKSPASIDVPDGKSLITQVDIDIYPRLDSQSVNIIEKYIAIFLDWEYGLTSRWIRSP